MYFRADSAAEGVRVIRDGSGFSVKLLTVIDELVSGFVESIAGAGNKSRERGLDTQELGDEQRMNHSVVVATISSHEGWEFAFEGGAHILFRHTAGDRRFVLILPLLHCVEAVLTRGWCLDGQIVETCQTE